jgi:hypothetical protein
MLTKTCWLNSCSHIVRMCFNTNGLHLPVVTHIACARVDIFDHYEITVSWPVAERYGGKEVMGAGAWA